MGLVKEKTISVIRYLNYKRVVNKWIKSIDCKTITERNKIKKVAMKIVKKKQKKLN